MYYKNFSQLLTVVLACSHATAESGSGIFRKPNDFEATDESLPHQGCKGLLDDRTTIQEPQVGAEYQRTHPESGYRVDEEAGATAATCVNGNAAGYQCNNVNLLSIVEPKVLSKKLNGGSAELNDIWGWTDSNTNREFALVGLETGTAFVEITDPVNPIYIGGLPTATSRSLWRDIKTIGNYAFIGAEASGHGIQIFDLTQLLDASPLPKTFTATARYTGVSNSHNVFCNEDTDYCYIVGDRSKCSGGPVAIDMSSPTNPSFAGCNAVDGYSHDVQCVLYDGPDSTYKGKEICFGSNEDTVTIVNAENKNNQKVISKVTYPNDRYTHQGWLTEDHRHFIFADELDEMGYGHNTRTHVVDVSDLDNPVYKQYYDGRTKAIDHQHYIIGDYVYQANYRAGFNVLKIKSLNSNDKSSKFDEAGFFDTYPSSDSNRFNGAWSTYPFFPSGTIVVSSIEAGLFVLKFTGGESSPTNSPVRSPVRDPTNSPVRSPVRDPTNSPVRSPTRATMTPTYDNSSFQPTPTSTGSQLPTPTISDYEPPTTGEPTSGEPTSGEPTTGEPTTGEPTTSEPTTSEPTTSEPTTAEPTSGAPDSNICADGKKNNCQSIGCHWIKADNECHMCTTFTKASDKKNCSKAGCNFDKTAENKCWSCNTMDSVKGCKNASCVWKNIPSFGDMCTPCAGIPGATKKVCIKAGCGKKGNKCNSCSSYNVKKCAKHKGCKTLNGACVGKFAK